MGLPQGRARFRPVEGPARQDLLPEFAEKTLEQLLATLKGVGEVRNDAGAHGQGPRLVEVPSHVAEYALNLAAAQIRLLGDVLKRSER